MQLAIVGGRFNSGKGVLMARAEEQRVAGPAEGQDAQSLFEDAAFVFHGRNKLKTYVEFAPPSLLAAS